MNISDEAVEAAINARGRANNPKWDHPRLGYKTFSDEQKDFLREQARIMLEAAAPHLIAETAADILEGMQAWAGDKELGFLEGYSDASDDAVTRSAGAGE